MLYHSPYNLTSCSEKVSTKITCLLLLSRDETGFPASLKIIIFGRKINPGSTAKMVSEELLQILQPVTHYSLHFLFPGLIAWVFFRKEWKKAWVIMIATMLVDADHLFAYPHIFVPDRCSIGFHPLHSWYAIAVYFIMAWFPPLRIIAIGLLFHMLADFIDCMWTGPAQ